MHDDESSPGPATATRSSTSSAPQADSSSCSAQTSPRRRSARPVACGSEKDRPCGRHYCRAEHGRTTAPVTKIINSASSLDENFLYGFKGGPLRGPPGAPGGLRARLRLFGRSGHAPPAPQNRHYWVPLPRASIASPLAALARTAASRRSSITLEVVPPSGLAYGSAAIHIQVAIARWSLTIRVEGDRRSGASFLSPDPPNGGVMPRAWRTGEDSGGDRTAAFSRGDVAPDAMMAAHAFADTDHSESGTGVQGQTAAVSGSASHHNDQPDAADNSTLRGAPISRTFRARYSADLIHRSTGMSNKSLIGPRLPGDTT
ncbi:hypothetical protein Nocox_00365 [Nonomuraea coxensis DSM 45129]|uniref:Uncharacterized protein n=1 Tax=Nonomuraea coxensis DSM 45129 TaxID=1122611 RepID=A0ABX8TQX7_9ACTN|nr:hypothetical protein Nocox_00365 [Nonomuraea coxensis DSM 45129]